MTKDEQKELVSKILAASAAINSSATRAGGASYMVVNPAIYKTIELYEIERQRKIKIAERANKINGLLDE